MNFLSENNVKFIVFCVRYLLKLLTAIELQKKCPKRDGWYQKSQIIRNMTLEIAVIRTHYY